jgi:hypothetical protein
MFRRKSSRSDSRNDSAAAQDIIFRHRAKVRDVGQQIGDSDEDQGNRICAFDRADGITDFRKDVVRVTVTDKRPEVSLVSAC